MNKSKHRDWRPLATPHICNAVCHQYKHSHLWQCSHFSDSTYVWRITIVHIYCNNFCDKDIEDHKVASVNWLVIKLDMIVMPMLLPKNNHLTIVVCKLMVAETCTIVGLTVWVKTKVTLMQRVLIKPSMYHILMIAQWMLLISSTSNYKQNSKQLMQIYISSSTSQPNREELELQLKICL